MKNLAEAELNYYSLKLVIELQRSNCVNMSVNMQFPIIWHKFVLNCNLHMHLSLLMGHHFHPMDYLGMYYHLVQGLPFEQTLACVTCSAEMVHH